MEVFTIGHSTSSFDDIRAALRRHGVTILADVRSRPYNPFIPQFNRERIKMELLGDGIVYAWLGDRLGRLPDGTPFTERSTVDFLAVERSEPFLAGIDWIVQQAAAARICLFCGEAEPEDCHRDFLIGRHLMARGFRVLNILPGGELEPIVQSLFHRPPAT